MLKIAGIVVLYNPVDRFIDNIRSYVHQVDVLVAIDNSEIVNPEFIENLKQLGNVRFRWMERNAGIAAALNAGVEVALMESCDYALLMDQDSLLSGDMVQVLKNRVSNGEKRIGLLYPRHVYHNYPQPAETQEEREILTADTAGSFLNLRAYRDVGGFADELFIDYVDFEYCLRLRKHGYTVLQINTICLYQQLGQMSSARFLFWTIGVSHHSPHRIYYRVRNRLFVARQYFSLVPRWSMVQMLYTVVDFLKIVLYEKEKAVKIKMVARGVIDYLSKKYGPYVTKN